MLNPVPPRPSTTSIAVAPRALLEQLEVFPLSTSGMVTVICLWDPHDNRRAQAAEMKLRKYYPDAVSYRFVQAVPPEGRSWMENALNVTYATQESPEPVLPVTCTFCRLGRDDVVTLVAGKSCAVCSNCAKILRSMPAAFGDTCDFCEGGSSSQQIVSRDGCAVCSGCLDLIDHIIVAKQRG